MYKIIDQSSSSIRNKITCFGAEELSNIELLSLMMSSNMKEKDALLKAHQLLTEVEDLSQLTHFSAKECQRLTGIGVKQSINLIAAIELGKRIARAEVRVGTMISSSKDFAKRLMIDYRYKKQEQVDLICLNAKHVIIHQVTIFKGTVTHSLAEPREILSVALRELATSIIIVHNHPSGQVHPSIDDKRFTARLKQSCELLGIRLLDHFIIGSNRYFSFKEANLI